MSINLTDELLAKTKKGKIASAKQVFLEGDQENLQQIGDKTHQLEDAFKDITVSGGASTSNAVSYNNETSGMTAVTAQGAIDELATKNKSQDATIAAKAEKSDVQSSVSELKAKNTSQDAEIAKKANTADVTSQMQAEQSRVNTELGKKFDKESILQESGEAEDKVMSQKVVSDNLNELSKETLGLINLFLTGNNTTPVKKVFPLIIGKRYKIVIPTPLPTDKFTTNYSILSIGMQTNDEDGKDIFSYTQSSEIPNNVEFIANKAVGYIYGRFNKDENVIFQVIGPGLKSDIESINQNLDEMQNDIDNVKNKLSNIGGVEEKLTSYTISDFTLGKGYSDKNSESPFLVIDIKAACMVLKVNGGDIITTKLDGWYNNICKYIETDGNGKIIYADHSNDLSDSSSILSDKEYIVKTGSKYVYISTRLDRLESSGYNTNDLNVTHITTAKTGELALIKSELKNVENKLNGTCPLITKKENTGINANSTNIGYWTKVNGYDAYVFDVSKHKGKNVKITGVYRANVYAIAQVTDYTLIPEDLNVDIWNRILCGKAIVRYNTGTTFTMEINIDHDANHIVILSSTDTEATCVAPSIYEQINGFTGIDILDLNTHKEFDNKVLQLSTRNISGSTKGNLPLVLAHFSDIHGDIDNLNRIIRWCSEYKNYINDIIHTGDNVKSQYSDGFDFWQIEGAEKILNVIGNHDTRDDNGNWTGIDAETSYNTFLKPYISNWEVTQPSDNENNIQKVCYYYKDYIESKIRLIVLDCMHKTTEQLEWFTSILQNSMTNNLAVIVAIHGLPIAQSTNGCTVANVDCNFTSNFYYDDFSTFPYSEISEPIFNFVKNGGEFIAFIGGHVHKDKICKITKDEISVPCILIDTARLDNYSTDHQRVAGAKSQDCFNLIGFDTTTKMIKIVRVGNDYDNRLRHIGTLCYNYINNKVIFES